MTSHTLQYTCSAATVLKVLGNTFGQRNTAFYNREPLEQSLPCFCPLPASPHTFLQQSYLNYQFTSSVFHPDVLFWKPGAAQLGCWLLCNSWSWFIEVSIIWGILPAIQAVLGQSINVNQSNINCQTGSSKFSVPKFTC